jgi:hypothetical protein
MPRFRAPLLPTLSGPFTLENVRALIAEVFRPAHLFLGPELELTWQQVEREEIAWEIFQGRLLDPAHTRQRCTFESWSACVSANDSQQPLLSLLLNADAGQLHIVRGLDCYVWEGYNAGGNVFESRERRKWVRELVGTLSLDRFADLDELRDELICRLFQTVVGTSRLPLSSVETPLPAFSFGQLFYCYRPAAPAASGPLRTWRELLTDMLAPSLHPSEQAHLLETFLHAVPFAEMEQAAAALAGRCPQWPALLRRLFNEVSLSPYTDLVEKTRACLYALSSPLSPPRPPEGGEGLGVRGASACQRRPPHPQPLSPASGERGEDGGLFRADQVVDFLSYLLRHIGRHLTAYDLVLFHHRGANYPDALLLDAVLKDYLSWIERRPELFADAAEDDDARRRRKRLRRRALRQGWLLRRRYEGHAVPDLPTSPGENMRVLPPSHPRVPEEQLTQPAHRIRRLYASDPLTMPAELLRQSFVDLEHPEEWCEMGLAIFLDRPFGIGKAPAEPDATLLLSAEAFSASIARERLHALARDLGITLNDAALQRLLAAPEVPGLPLDAIGGAIRPGTVSLSDARRAASDFVFLRTTPGSARAFWAQYDITPLARRIRLDDLQNGADVLLARSLRGPGVVIYDADLRPRLEVEVVTEGGFVNRAGQEYSRGGLRVVHPPEAACVVLPR